MAWRKVENLRWKRSRVKSILELKLVVIVQYHLVMELSIHGEGPSGECKMEQEQKEEESDDDMETDYGSVGMVDEDFSVFEELEPTEYDDLTRKPSRV